MNDIKYLLLLWRTGRCRPLLLQFSISQFHIWREGASAIDTPPLQIWNSYIENWGSKGQRGVVWINRGGCVLIEYCSPSSFNTQVSYLERRCIYSRCAFPPNMKLGYWKLREQWTTRCCMNSPRWMCFNWIFVLRQVSISKFHIWSEGVSIADAPSLQIWNWDIENWRSSGRQGPVRHNNNKYFMSSSFVSCYFPTWP